MKPYLADVNVWLALMVQSHQHHGLAIDWYDSLGRAEAGLCRIVQLSLIRLLANPAILGEQAQSPATSWRLIETLLQDERVEFCNEPPALSTTLVGLWKYPVPTGKLVNDAYLAAFAKSGGYRLLTLDRGFRQFHGLDVTVLGA